jgi:hypothetical protein
VIGGLAVNCYVDPVYTLDADLVVITSKLPGLSAHLAGQARTAGSDLRIQFTTDERYQAFLSRSEDAEILGIRARVACLKDVTLGKLWACSDPRRRLSKRKKDELDLIRLAKRYPELPALYPANCDSSLIADDARPAPLYPRTDDPKRARRISCRRARGGANGRGP